jgi:hypothetical protein
MDCSGYTPLCLLAEKHLTDKGPKFHGYTKFYYNAITSNFDPAAVKKVGEIGIGFLECMCHVSMTYKPGASLRMWEAFFPNAEIHGFDIRKETLINEGRIQCHYMDQGDVASIETSLRGTGEGGFDILIDDGSHIIYHQLNTKNYTRPYLKMGGLLIIEDIEERFLEYHFTTPPEGMELVSIATLNPSDNWVIYRRIA